MHLGQLRRRRRTTRAVSRTQRHELGAAGAAGQTPWPAAGRLGHAPCQQAGGRLRAAPVGPGPWVSQAARTCRRRGSVTGRGSRRRRRRALGLAAGRSSCCAPWPRAAPAARPHRHPSFLSVSVGRRDKDEIGERIELSWALFSSTRKPKNFQDFPSHRIFQHMHETLNIDENKN